jgi:itaconate CoA-transferase
MDITALYKSKLTTPEIAVGRIASGTTLSMGMAMTEPPALLKALADRAAAGKVDNLKIYYFESTLVAGRTILRYELYDRIHPYCMFMSGVERALIEKGEQDGRRKVVSYVPSNFSQSSRLLAEHIGIDTFLITVSPMDQHGYFTLGTGNDYSSKVARAARHLIVEANGHMPRVYGSLAQLHVSEVETIVENHVTVAGIAGQ